MDIKKLNPYNSDTLQICLDLLTAMDRSGIELTDINDIIEELKTEGSELRTVADQIYHNHKYPDKSVGFSQTARYDDKALFYELPRGEQALFNLMCDIQDPQTGYVTVIKHMFVKVLRFTDTERKHLQRYLDDLTEKGFLYCHYRPTNKKPGEYRINQSISWIGKRDKTQLTKLKKFQSEYTIGKSTVILKDGTKINSGTLQILDLTNIEKKVSAGNTDPQELDNSISQVNSNQDKQKNQDIKTKSTELLTLEEAQLFEPQRTIR